MVNIILPPHSWPYLVFCASDYFALNHPRFGSSVERGFKGGITPKGAEGGVQSPIFILGFLLVMASC